MSYSILTYRGDTREWKIWPFSANNIDFVLVPEPDTLLLLFFYRKNFLKTVYAHVSPCLQWISTLMHSVDLSLRTAAST